MIKCTGELSPVHRYIIFSKGGLHMDQLKRIEDVLHAPFDIKTHQETFINYLEVIIHKNGRIEYSTPSHAIKLAEIYGKSMDEVFEEFDEGILTDPIEFLCRKTGAIAVWWHDYTGTPNEIQINQLKMLKKEGIYHGPIHKKNLHISTNEWDE